MTGHRLPFNIMTMPIGAICNIDCTYCYYIEKEKMCFNPSTLKLAILTRLL